MGLTALGFSYKTWKKWHEHSVFERTDENMNLRAVCCLENRRTYDKIWVWEQRFFREDSEKKAILWTFMAHQVFWFWQNWRFLTKYRRESMRCLWKIKKKTWEHRVFKRVDVFLTKRGDESHFFLENEHFLTKHEHKSSNFFFVRNRKKGIILTFLA